MASTNVTVVMAFVFFAVGLATELQYPLTAMDADARTQWAQESTHHWRDLMSGDLSWGQYKNSGPDWGKDLVIRVDNVAYKNLGQWQSQTVHARNLLKPGSMRITEEATVTDVTEDSLSYHYCLEVVFNLDVAVFDASQVINKCVDRKKTFNADLELIESEVISGDNSFAGKVTNFVMNGMITTITPLAGAAENALFDGNSASYEGSKYRQVRILATNPIFLSMVALFVGGTLLVAIAVCCGINYCQRRSGRRGKYAYKNVEAFSSSFETDADDDQEELIMNPL